MSYWGPRPSTSGAFCKEDGGHTRLICTKRTESRGTNGKESGRSGSVAVGVDRTCYAAHEVVSNGAEATHSLGNSAMLLCLATRPW